MATTREGNFVNLTRANQLNKFASFVTWMKQTLTGEARVVTMEAKTLVEPSLYRYFTRLGRGKSWCSLPVHVCVSSQGTFCHSPVAGAVLVGASAPGDGSAGCSTSERRRPLSE